MALERGKLSNVVRVSAGTTVGIITSTEILRRFILNQLFVMLLERE